jgi:EAL and modified HD-GYP domain-containing signal transduction protein
MSTLIALQPCFDRREQVRTYVVAYRTRLPVALTDHEDPLAVTLGAVIDALLDVGVTRVTGGHPGLLRVRREALADPQLQRLNPKAAIILLDGTADATAHLAAAGARSLAAAGFGIAVELPADAPAAGELVETANLLVLDAVGRTPDAMAAPIAAARVFGKPLLVRAAAPGSPMDAWSRAGASLVEYSVLAVAPRTPTAGKPAINDVNALRLLGELRNPDLPDARLEEGFQRDLALSYELLKLVNSAAVAGREIWSIGHAIRLLGREVIHRRLAALVLRSLGDKGTRSELAHRARVRGRFCELLADDLGLAKARGPLFAVGFLSLLPDLLGIAPTELGKHVPLAADIRGAIESRADFYGAVLAMVEAYEGARWDGVDVRCAAEGIPVEQLAARYLAAVAWAREQLGATRAQAA